MATSQGYCVHFNIVQYFITWWTNHNRAALLNVDSDSNGVSQMTIYPRCRMLVVIHGNNTGERTLNNCTPNNVPNVEEVMPFKVTRQRLRNAIRDTDPVLRWKGNFVRRWPSLYRVPIDYGTQVSVCSRDTTSIGILRMLPLHAHVNTTVTCHTRANMTKCTCMSTKMVTTSLYAGVLPHIVVQMVIADLLSPSNVQLTTKPIQFMMNFFREYSILICHPGFAATKVIRTFALLNI